MKTLSTLEIYRMFIQSIIRTNGTQRISNSSLEHASVLMGELIRSARRSVDVFCHRLSSDIWGGHEILEAVTFARSHGSVVFRVVVQEKSEMEITKGAFAFMADTIRVLPQTTLKANFLLVDKKSFRVEPDFHERKGFAYVNNSEFSGVLVNAFDALYQAAV